MILIRGLKDIIYHITPKTSNLKNFCVTKCDEAFKLTKRPNFRQTLPAPDQSLLSPKYSHRLAAVVCPNTTGNDLAFCTTSSANKNINLGVRYEFVWLDISLVSYDHCRIFIHEIDGGNQQHSLLCTFVT